MAARIFDTERFGETLIVVPLDKVSSLADTAVLTELDRVADELDACGPNLLVDFSRAEYFGSSMLEALLRLSKLVQARRGKMGLCSLSEASAEVLKISKFDTLWPIYMTRQQAMAAIPE